MTITQLQQLVGPINRGQLEQGFIPERTILDKQGKRDDDDDEVTPYKPPPPPIEDLSYLNPRSSATSRENVSKVWRALSPEERRRRKRHLAVSGLNGGKATKNVRHRHY